MNLVQKLPIGLGLACMMMLSSCSKEDAQVAPVQEIGKAASSGANLKVRGPVISSSQGSVTGSIDSYSSLQGWFSKYNEKAGVSNFKNVFGDPSKPWENQLPVFFQGPSTFVTLKVSKTYEGFSITKMEGLIPGKKYKVTFSLSTSKPAGSQMLYVDNVEVSVTPNNQNVKKIIDLSGKQGQWITDSIIFVAEKDVQAFNVYTDGPEIENANSMVNILVSQNALQQLN